MWESITIPPQAMLALTKREWLAGLAMASLLTQKDFFSAPEEQIAKYAVAQADALLAALKEEEGTR